MLSSFIGVIGLTAFVLLIIGAVANVLYGDG